MIDPLLTPEERTRLARMASSCAPEEWGAAGHAAEILKCLDEGILPSPRAIEWYVTYFRKNAT